MATLPAPLRDLRRRFRPGYTFERTGSGHYRVRDPEGRYVTGTDGNNLTMSGTPGGGRALQNMTTQLENAGVLRKPGEKRPPRRTAQQNAESAERLRIATEARRQRRAIEAKALHDRLAKMLEPMGGLEIEGRGVDLGLIASKTYAREMRTSKGGHVTPDMLAESARKVIAGAWVETRYQEVWNAIAEQVEGATDPVGEWYALVREARGLPDDVVEVKKPAKGDWPFSVELIPVEYLVVDHGYQRPVPWPFVRKLAATYDESLVGTIDVARRSPSRFAILDGQLRYEATKLVGKGTIWASVYAGLDLQSEARFFLHKNRDRKAIHPFYTFKARVVAGDPDAVETEKIVAAHGYRIALTAMKIEDRSTEGNLSAPAAVEDAYKRKRPDGSPALGPTLEVMRAATLGRPNGNSALLVRGLAMVFQGSDNGSVDPKLLTEVVAELGPDLILGRARDLARGSGGQVSYSTAKVIAAAYNRKTPKGENLRLF